MLFYLFSSEELSQVFEQLGYSFDPGCIPRNIEYYLQRTSHGSTLSWIVHSWVLSRGDRSGSWELFLGALESDIGDIQGGTTPEGIHLGAMAGTVDLVQRCYTGLETRGGILHINPSLPDRLHCLKARVYYRKHLLDLDITHERLRITSPHCAAAPVTVAYRGRFREICPGAVFEFRLIKPNERDRGDAGLNSLKAEE